MPERKKQKQKIYHSYHEKSTVTAETPDSLAISTKKT